MDIGLNETTTITKDLTKENISKKKDIDSLDFSTISSQFANIFSNQVVNQFQKQFNYSNMFSQAPKADFTAQAVTTYSDVQSVKPESFYNNNKYNDTKSAQNETSENTRETAAKPEEKEEIHNENKTTDEKNEIKKDLKETAETADKNSTEKPHKKTEATSVVEKDTISAQKDNVEIKGDVAVDKTATTAEKDLSQIDVKIEKLDVKKQASVATTAENHTKAEVSKDSSTKKVEDIQKKAEMERATSNVIDNEKITEETAAPKVSTEQKPVDKESRFSLKTDKATTAPQSESRVSTNLLQNQNNSHEQSFAQNQNFSNQQQNNSGKSITDNLLNNSISFNSSMLSALTNKNNVQFSGTLQSTQATTMSERNIADQVMKQIQGNISSTKDSQLTMVLQPEKLGKVTLNIMNEKGVLSAEIKTESKEAAEALNKNINDLKETLEKQGVTCSNLVVKAEASDKSQNQMNFAQQQPNQENLTRNNAQNSNQNGRNFENNSNKSDIGQSYNNFENDIQENQEMPTQNQATQEKQGLVDYRV